MALTDRNRLSEGGVVVVVIPITIEDSGIMEPEIFTKGFIFSDAPDSLLEKAKDIVFDTVRGYVREKNADSDRLKRTVKERLKEYFYRETAKDPVIVPIVIDI